MSDQGPTVFNGRYELLRHIARGGMADVYLARDELLGREVALKVLFPEFANDPSFVERFRREAQAAANLNHPNIVGIYDWGQERGTYYIVMEHVSGRSMSDVLRSTGPLNPDRAAEIASDVASALATAHQAGLVHRDVKPGNILVSDAGDVKVADFGIATALAGGTDAGLTQHGSVMGTATYFSPEQAQGKQVDGRSDLYSLGVVLYEMLAGTPPFQAETPVGVAYKHVQERPESLSERGVSVASSLEAITMKLLAKNPANRYPAADDLRADLRRYLAGAHQVPGGTAAAAGAAGAVGAAAGSPGDGVDPTIVQPVTPASSLPAVVPATSPGGPVTDPTALAADYGAGYYYDDDLPDEENWKRTAALLVGLGLLIFVLGFLSIAFGRQLGLFGDDDSGDDDAIERVEIPNLDGLLIEEAEAQLRELGLVPVRNPQPNANVPVDEVFDQFPPAGQRVDPGEEVEIFVSTGEATTVPSVIALSQEDATARLQEAGYEVVLDEQFNDQDVGKVISQDPRAGTELEPGEPVTIVVSRGPEQKPIPDVAGRSLGEAFNLLTEEGFRPASETIDESSDSVPANRVTRTDPPVGSLAAIDSPVVIYVSTGTPKVSVPAVVGSFYDTAEATLRNVGLVPVPQFETVPFGDPQVGLVIRQNPSNFTEVDLGSEVVIVVGEAGPEPTTTTTTTTTTEPPDD